LRWFWSMTVNGPMTRADRVATLEEAEAQCAVVQEVALNARLSKAGIELMLWEYDRDGRIAIERIDAVTIRSGYQDTRAGKVFTESYDPAPEHGYISLDPENPLHQALVRWGRAVEEKGAAPSGAASGLSR
jgi:hypothetical protein